MDITIGYYKERETRYQDGGADPKLIAAAQEALAGAFEAYREDWSGIEVKGALDGAALATPDDACHRPADLDTRAAPPLRLSETLGAAPPRGNPPTLSP